MVKHRLIVRMFREIHVHSKGGSQAYPELVDHFKISVPLEITIDAILNEGKSTAKIFNPLNKQ